MTKKASQLQSVGITIRNYRQSAGLSQERLGERMGVSTNYISLLESGKRYPSIGTLIRIARALDANPGEMLNAIVAREGM